tara:strand:- start:170 stop:454 length:285 start_codon:yes stop_codon:yes gene_type:complete
MFIELTIIYPFKNTHSKIADLLKKQKEDLLSSRKCVEYSIYNDTYLNKIIHIIKWESKDTMKASISTKTHRKRLEEMLNLQKFPSEVYHLEEIE